MAILLVALLLGIQLVPIDSVTIVGNCIDVDIYGNVYVIDSERNIVRLFSKDLTPIAETGGSGWGETQFDRPSGIWARNGIDVFIADYGNHRIQRFDRKLNFVASFSTRNRDSQSEQFGYPTDVALSRQGDLYVCDNENSRVVKLNGFTRVERGFGGFDAGSGRLSNPSRVEVGPQDRIYVVDGARVVVFDSFGNFLHQIGMGMFKKHVALGADASGLVVADKINLYTFDEADRLVETIPLDEIVPAPEVKIHSLAIHRETVYLLTETGLIRIPFPHKQQ